VNEVVGPIQANQAAIEQGMSLPENQRFVAFAERGGLLDFFAARGISRDQATQCLSDAAAIKALAERLRTQSDKDNITGTPTFFINGNRVDGIEWAPVEAALQRAGAR
jgi:protein-disulfide isomerase